MILKRVLLFQDTISSNNVVLKLLLQTSTANNYHQIYFSQIGFYWMLEKSSAIIHLQDSQDRMQPRTGVLIQLSLPPLPLSAVSIKEKIAELKILFNFLPFFWTDFEYLISDFIAPWHVTAQFVGDIDSWLKSIVK